VSSPVAVSPSAPSPASRRRQLAVLWLVGSPAAIGLLFVHAPDNSGFWLSQLTYATLLVALLLLKWHKDPFEPVLAVVAVYALFYLRGLYLHYELNQELLNPVVRDNLQYLTRAMNYLTIGILAYVAAYVSPVARALGSAIPQARWLRMPADERQVLFLYALAMGVSFLRIVFPGIVFFSKTVAVIAIMVGNLSYLAMFLFTTAAFRKHWAGQSRTLRLAVILLLVQVALGLFSGYREPVAIALLTFLASYHYAGGRVRFWHIAAAGGLVVFVITPLVLSFRVLTWTASSNVGGLQALMSAPETMRNMVIARTGSAAPGAWDFFKQFAELISIVVMARFHGPDSIITILARVPEELPFEWGRTLFFMPISALIPRLLWPGKPDTGLGDYFRETFWQGGGGSIAITQVGEFYLNFGVIGVVAGMAVLGILHRAFYEYVRRSMSMKLHALLVLALPYFLVVDRDISLTYASVFKLVIFALVALYFMRNTAGPATTRTQ